MVEVAAFSQEKCGARSDDHVRLKRNQFRGQAGKSGRCAFCAARLGYKMPSVDVATLSHAGEESFGVRAIGLWAKHGIGGAADSKYANAIELLRMLCPTVSRPGLNHNAPCKRNELPPPHFESPFARRSQSIRWARTGNAALNWRASPSSAAGKLFTAPAPTHRVSDTSISGLTCCGAEDPCLGRVNIGCPVTGGCPCKAPRPKGRYPRSWCHLIRRRLPGAPAG